MNNEQLSVDPTDQTVNGTTVTASLDHKPENSKIRRIEPSRGWVSLGLRELWELPRTDLLFHLARYQSPLQTNHPGRSVGDYPAAPHDVNL